MEIAKRFIRGSSFTKTRLHDEKGNLIGLRRLLLNGPRAITTGLLSVFGYRPELPWISYAAAHEIEKALDSRHSVVLEFGSGMSTIWLARRSAKVYSVEHSDVWFGFVAEHLQRLSLENVVYELRPEKDAYIHFPDTRDVFFDFVLIDGLYRSDCLKNAISRLKPGGLIYLDDCDKDMTVLNGDMRIAEACLCDIAQHRQGKLVYYTDVAPTQFFVKQGALCRISPGSLSAPVDNRTLTGKP